MNNYKGIVFTIKARTEDQAKISETITQEYPGSNITFIDADLVMPSVSSVNATPGHWVSGMQSKTDSGEWRSDFGGVLMANAAHLLLTLFSGRIS